MNTALEMNDNINDDTSDSDIFTLDKNLRLCPLDNGHHQAEPTCPLGTLDQRLPLELISMIIELLDLRSLTDFRRINRRAMQIIDSIPQYKAIVTHAPITLRGILSIGTGKWISCRDLYHELFTTTECERCGDFGDHLYLITPRRVCFFCFLECDEFLPLGQEEAIRKFGLRRGVIAQLPSMRTVKGKYAFDGRWLRSGLKFIDYGAARELGLAIHGTTAKMKHYASDKLSTRLHRFSVRDRAGRMARRPRTEDELDMGELNPRRFVAIVRIPFLNIPN